MAMSSRLLALLLLYAPSAWSQGFTDISAASGLKVAGAAIGAGWADYDGDGLPDLYCNGVGHLYHNDGGLTFTQAGGWSSADNRGTYWGDWDNDGDPDLMLTHGLNLLRNDGGVFVDVDEASVGISGITNLGGANWVDFDRDGNLDIWAPDDGNNRVFMGNGAGAFTETSPSGLTSPGDGETTAQADYDNDGDIDLLYRLGDGYLWQDQGNQTVVEVRLSTGLDLFEAAGGFVGQAFADYDNDGDLDLYVGTDTTNRLYENVGGSFVDVTTFAGVAGTSDNSTGTSWADYDNDGWLDLYVSQGGAHNHLFHNNTDGTFTDEANALGVRGGGMDQSTAARWADADLDGDLDLFLARNGGDNRLYQNDQDDDNHLSVKVVGQGTGGAPKDGNGSRVSLFDATSLTLLAMREIGGSEGYASSATQLQHFGLGTIGGATVDYLVTVDFLGGGTQQCRITPSNQSLNIGSSVLMHTIQFDQIDPDGDGDGRPDWCDRCLGFDDTIDGDGDGVADDCDPCPYDNPDDADGDGWCDSLVLCIGNPLLGDLDNDGICEDLDLCWGQDNSGDMDGDGHCLVDTEGLNYWDCDDADSAINPAALEIEDGIDNNCDGLIDDSDGDGLSDEVEFGDGETPQDSDGDGIPDIFDTDDDGDGIPTSDELGPGPDPLDTDGDLEPDFLDLDSDGDGVSDEDEGDGDIDCDGVINRLDADDEDGDCDPDVPGEERDYDSSTGASTGGTGAATGSGGSAPGAGAFDCGCATQGSAGWAWWLPLLALFRRKP
jgi:hypothetical protein